MEQVLGELNRGRLAGPASWIIQLATGRANKEIADTLKISEHTVKDHLKRILGKLHVADRTEAVTAALQRGIIHLR